MFEQVPKDPGLREGETVLLQFWRESDVFNKLRAKNAGKPRWSFLDGPITANNPMGVHHAWGRTYKDVFQRYFAMTGHDQRFQNGFDCQGLWVEVEVERELGFKSKKDIEQYGIERFINACKERVLRFATLITEASIRLGMWMDWDNSYFTMSDENNYTIWSFLKKCHKRGFVYRGLDSMPWCPRCGTGISEQERREGYRLIEDESVYVRFPLRGRPGEHLLVWTTTPWTLSANVAAAVSPDLIYVKVEQDGAIYYLAEARLDTMGQGDKPKVLERMSGSKMIGWPYDGPFDDLAGALPAVPAHRVIPWEDVSGAEGTGIVHIAPGCGKEDFELSKIHGLPVIAPIDESGNYEDGFGFLTGKYAGAVTSEIYEDLKRKKLFYKDERYTHDYPHCWRCGTQLLFRAVDEWYIGMGWRDEIAEVAKQVRWIPEHFLDLELDWLRNMGDWMISKKRYWGLALPIFECAECGWFDVIGGRDELQERAIEGWEQFEGQTPHRPWIDAVKIECGNCGAKVSRIPDVGNPWLDAGIVPYSTVGYNTDRSWWSAWIPAEFIVESFPGQFRNWFYALLAMSTMMENTAPFRNLFGYALVRDKFGEEMSKSKGNSIEFLEASERVSVDGLRWMYCRQPPLSNIHFDYEDVDRIERRVFGTLWNTYAFLSNYARLDQFDPTSPKIPVSERQDIDRWILSNLQMLVSTAHRNYRDYWVMPLIKQAEEFVEELSNWYIRRNRRRFWRGRGEDDRDKLAAYQTLYEVLTTLLKILAPVIPFFTERLYQNFRGEGEPESIHLCDFPEADQSLVDEELSRSMTEIRYLVTEGHALREKAQIRVRQPLPELRVQIAGDPGTRSGLERLSMHITEELNVKRLNLVDTLDVQDQDQGEWLVNEGSFMRVALNVRVTPKLVREGLARDVVRHVQQLRKDSGLNVEDRIDVGYETGDSSLLHAIEEWEKYLMQETLADSLVRGPLEGASEASVKIGKITLNLWVRPR